MKYLKSDSSKNFTSLEMDWASRNNCKQRAGRAGRVANGRCYRLVKRRFFEVRILVFRGVTICKLNRKCKRSMLLLNLSIQCYMTDSPTPEILLTPLENVILKAKTFELEAPHILLGLAIDPPDLYDVANTVLTLKELGALHLTLEDKGYSPIDGDLTFLGHIMSSNYNKSITFDFKLNSHLLFQRFTDWCACNAFNSARLLLQRPWRVHHNGLVEIWYL